MREELLPLQTWESAAQFLGYLAGGVAEEHNAGDLFTATLGGPLMHELRVSNYAGYNVRTEYGDLKLKNLFTGCDSLVPSVQSISISTVNGQLGMTLVSREPFPTLLEDAREILLHA